LNKVINVSDRISFLASGWMLIGFSALIIIVVGLRFAYLDRRVYWHDEVLTALSAAGYKPGDVLATVYGSPPFAAGQLQWFQNTVSDESWIPSLRPPADPFHPPLYFAIARGWMLLAGTSPAVMRALPAAISLLALPSIYWLAWLLFRRRIVAAVAVCLMCVSPMFVLLARESRHYSLWAVATIVSSALLLHALQGKSWPRWVIYSATLVVGLYTHMFFLFVVLSHGAFFLLTYLLQSADQRPSSRTLLAYVTANLVALLFFVPWLISIIPDLSHASSGIAWASNTVPLTLLIRISAARYGGVFVDLDPFSILVQLGFYVPVLMLAGYSLFFLWRKGPGEGRRFVFLLAAVPVLALVIPDLLLGGWRSAVARFLVPVFVALLLAMANLLGEKLAQPAGPRRTGWMIVAGLLLVVGLLSSIWAVRATAWWDKGSDYAYAEMTQVINSAERPLVIIGEPRKDVFGRALSIATSIDPEVHMLWVETVEPMALNDYSDVFFFRPTTRMRESVEVVSGQQLAPVVPGLMWRLTMAED
jgi:uncharacterized membrane protein